MKLEKSSSGGCRFSPYRKNNTAPAKEYEECEEFRAGNDEAKKAQHGEGEEEDESDSELDEATEVRSKSLSLPNSCLSPSPEPKYKYVYRFDFGKHNGFTLAEVQDRGSTYIHWIIEHNVAGDREDLADALEEHPGAYSQPAIRCRRKQAYSSPSYEDDDEPVPLKFMYPEKPSGDHLWIDFSHARRCFGLTFQHLSRFDQMDKRDDPDDERARYEKPRYWLYDVWDFVKVHESRFAADMGLKRYFDRIFIRSLGQDGRTIRALDPRYRP